MRKKQESIAALINASKTLIPTTSLLIDNYPELLHTGISIEFKTAVWELDNWVNEFGFGEEDAFKQVFLQLCASRDDYVANSLLSYSGLPDGLCNALFWEIARFLYPQNTLIDQIKLLIPSVTHVVQFQYNYPINTPKTIQLNYKLIPLEQSNVLATDLSSPTVLKEYAIAGSLLFDLKELISLPFALHLQWYTLLQKNQQALLCQIVQHNDDLRKLHADLQLISQGGLTPNEAITHLMNELKRSGERLSGDEFALAPAPIALAAFFEYLNSLPETLQLEVLELPCPGNKGLADILEDLQSDKCVQTAADELLSILENKANAKTLVIKPNLTEEQVQAIYDRYTQGNHIKSINIVGNGGNGVLPNGLRRELYGKLFFDDSYELIDFLQIIPLEDYSAVLNTKDVIELCNSESNTEEIGYYADVLNAEQIQELFVCLVKYGIANDSKIVRFIQHSNHATVLQILPQVLAQYREHHFVQFLTQVDNDSEDDPLLEWLEMQGSPDHLYALQAILLLLLEKSAKGEMAMYAVNANRIFRRLANHAWGVLEALYNNTPHKSLLCDELMERCNVHSTPMFNLLRKVRYQTDDPTSVYRFILSIFNHISAKALADFLTNEKCVIELILGSTYPHNVRLLKVCFTKITSHQLITLLLSDCLNIGSENTFQAELLHFVFAYTPYQIRTDALLKCVFEQLQPVFLFKLLHEKLADNEEETTLSTLLHHIGGNRRKHAHFAWEYMSVILQNIIQKSPNDLSLLSKILHFTHQSNTVLLYLISQIDANTIPISLKTMQLVLKHLPDNPCQNLVDEVMHLGNKKLIKTLWTLDHPVIAMRHQEQLEKSSHKQKYGTFFAEELKEEEPNKKRKIEDETLKK
jgi:hypothetical protein